MSLVERALKKMQTSNGVPVEASAHQYVPGEAGPPVFPQGSGTVVQLDRLALRAAGLLPPEHQERQIAEQFRQIKRPLVNVAQQGAAGSGPSPRLVMVTSAMPGEGKTFTSLNLAMSLARERDVRVLLMDADVAKPHVSRLFGADNEPGLLDMLRDTSIEPESLVMQVEGTGLCIMPAGQRTDAAPELLASQRLGAVLNMLLARDPSRIIVIDSPPLLLTNESRILASAMGQVVVVVGAGKTSQQDVQTALGFLDSSRQAIGLVLNQSMDPSTTYSYHGYGDSQPEATTGA